MKVSEYIKKLQELQRKHGDLDVAFMPYDSAYFLYDNDPCYLDLRDDDDDEIDEAIVLTMFDH